MPRAHTPGPFTPAADIRHEPFQFEAEARSDLIKRLVRDLDLPDPKSVKVRSTAQIEMEHSERGREPSNILAERIVDWAQKQISVLRSARADDVKTTPGNASSYREAIAQLRAAMRPFREGWVDSVTADIANWHEIDAALGRRDEALKQEPRRGPWQDARATGQLIFGAAHQMARHAGFYLDEKATLGFTFDALSAAEVQCPDWHERPARFREFVSISDEILRESWETSPQP